MCVCACVRVCVFVCEVEESGVSKLKKCITKSFVTEIIFDLFVVTQYLI